MPFSRKRPPLKRQTSHQKLKRRKSNPNKWTPAEVRDWMEENDRDFKYVDLISVAQKMERESVTGRRLSKMTKRDWKKYGLTRKQDITAVGDMVEGLFGEEEVQDPRLGNPFVDNYRPIRPAQRYSQSPPSRKRHMVDALPVPDSGEDAWEIDVMQLVAVDSKVPPDFLSTVKDVRCETMMVPCEIVNLRVDGKAEYDVVTKQGKNTKTETETIIYSNGNGGETFLFPKVKKFLDLKYVAFFKSYVDKRDEAIREDMEDIDDLEEEDATDFNMGKFAKDVAKLRGQQLAESAAKDFLAKAKATLKQLIGSPRARRTRGDEFVVPVITLEYEYEGENHTVLYNPITRDIVRSSNQKLVAYPGSSWRDKLSEVGAAGVSLMLSLWLFVFVVVLIVGRNKVKEARWESTAQKERVEKFAQWKEKKQ